MKFAKQLQDHQDHQWTEQYLDYKRMKKVLKQDEGDELVATFMESLEAELCKVREFMLGFVEGLLKDVQPTDANDATSTNKREELVQNIVRFRKFAALNREGLRKILKKFRKSVDAEHLAMLPDDPFAEQICSADDIDIWLLGPAQHCHQLLVPEKDRLSPATARQVNFWLEELKVGLLLAAQRNMGPANILSASTFPATHLLDTALRLQLWGDRADTPSSWLCIKNGFIDAPMAPETETKSRHRRASSVPVSSSRSRQNIDEGFADGADESPSPCSSPKASRKANLTSPSFPIQTSRVDVVPGAVPASATQSPCNITNDYRPLESIATLPIAACVTNPCNVVAPESSEASMTPRRVDLPLSYRQWCQPMPVLGNSSAGELLRMQARPSLPAEAAAATAHNPLEPREVVVNDPSSECKELATLGKLSRKIPTGRARRGRRGDLREPGWGLQPGPCHGTATDSGVMHSEPHGLTRRDAPAGTPEKIPSEGLDRRRVAGAQFPSCAPPAPEAPAASSMPGVGPAVPPGVWGSSGLASGSTAVPGFDAGTLSSAELVAANLPQDPMGRPPGRPPAGQQGVQQGAPQGGACSRPQHLQQAAPSSDAPQQISLQHATAPLAPERGSACNVGRWWTKVDAELMCPLSNFPIQMLPYPPFKYQVCQGKESARLVDGGFLAIKVLATLDFEVLGRPMNVYDVSSLDAYVKRCKLGPWRVAKALQLRTAGTAAALQELQALQDQARRKFKKLKHIKQTRLQSAGQPPGPCPVDCG